MVTVGNNNYVIYQVRVRVPPIQICWVIICYNGGRSARDPRSHKQGPTLNISDGNAPLICKESGNRLCQTLYGGGGGGDTVFHPIRAGQMILLTGRPLLIILSRYYDRKMAEN